MRSKYYFIRLFFVNKFLFVFVFIFFIVNVAANFIFKAEETPVFRWDLYSQEIPEKNDYSFLEVRYNDGELLTFSHTWQEPEKLLFTNTLDLFINMQRNNGNDPSKVHIDSWNNKHSLFKKILPGLKFYNDSAELKEYPAWYKRYLEQHIKKPVYKIEVYEVKVAYQDNGEIKKLSSTLIYKLL